MNSDVSSQRYRGLILTCCHLSRFRKAMYASKHLHLCWLSSEEIHKGTKEDWLWFRKKLVFKMCFKQYKWRHLLKIAKMAKIDIQEWRIDIQEIIKRNLKPTPLMSTWWNILLQYWVFAVEKFNELFWRDAKFFSVLKLKPRYLCDDTSRALHGSAHYPSIKTWITHGYPWISIE